MKVYHAIVLLPSGELLNTTIDTKVVEMMGVKAIGDEVARLVERRLKA